MRRWLTVAMLGVVCVGAPDGAAQPQLGQALKKNGWYASHEAAKAAARQSGKPMLVVFRCER